jgi:glutaredoxin
MSNSIRGLILYTQNDCLYCEIMKAKLKDWGYNWDEVNISYTPGSKDFMKSEGHRTVPQLYHFNTHVNKVDTADFTKEMLEEAIDPDQYSGGVESFR